MKRFTLVGVDGNAFEVMAYGKKAMVAAEKDCKLPDYDVQVDEIHLQDLKRLLFNKVNEYFEV